LVGNRWLSRATHITCWGVRHVTADADLLFDWILINEQSNSDY
jgi:hypothetical protein